MYIGYLNSVKGCIAVWPYSYVLCVQRPQNCDADRATHTTVGKAGCPTILIGKLSCQIFTPFPETRASIIRIGAVHDVGHQSETFARFLSKPTPIAVLATTVLPYADCNTFLEFRRRFPRPIGSSLDSRPNGRDLFVQNTLRNARRIERLF